MKELLVLAIVAFTADAIVTWRWLKHSKETVEEIRAQAKKIDGELTK